MGKFDHSGIGLGVAVSRVYIILKRVKLQYYDDSNRVLVKGPPPPAVAGSDPDAICGGHSFFQSHKQWILTPGIKIHKE